jgi:type IV secretory pathway VirD2 relaxase
MNVPPDEFEPKLGRISDRSKLGNLRTTKRIVEHAAKSARIGVGQRSHIPPGARRRGTAPGVLARAGLIAPGTRRVTVRARYTRQHAGHGGAARAHLRYIQRDGVTREGEPGRLYDAVGDDVDAAAFLERAESDAHQFRFIVSAEDSSRLRDLKPFIRDLMRQLEQDLDTKLDWVAVDHFNTGHPHTHIVIRGRDDRGQMLVMARDYIAHGVRARAQALVTLQLGPENDLERMQKLMNEVEVERLTRIDRMLLAKSKANIVVILSADERDPVRQTMMTGRLKTLERLGLASERQRSVWELDAELGMKLRRLGERADTYKMMQRALATAGIDCAGSQLALFERGRRQTSVIGKTIAVGLVDEISDRHYVIVDGIDGRVHYADLGRLRQDEIAAPGMIVSLASDSLYGRPRSTPRLKVLSTVGLEELPTYEGPTWLDQSLASKRESLAPVTGFAGQLEAALEQRRRWLAQQGLADLSASGACAPRPNLRQRLEGRERLRIEQRISRELKAAHVPARQGSHVVGVYDRAIATPTGKIAVIRRDGTFTLAPWTPALEPCKGKVVIGSLGRARVTWSLDRGHGLARGLP